MKVRFLKLKSWLLLTVMGSLGFSACNCHKKLADPEPETDPVEIKDRGEIRLMYGVPTMNYMIRGQVRDTEGRPVKGIRVNMLERNMEVDAASAELQGDPERVKEYLESTSVVTDKKGRFEIKNSGIPQEQVRLLVRDVDGNENGEYRNQLFEVPVNGEDIDRTDASGWNQGTFNKDVEVKLESR